MLNLTIKIRLHLQSLRIWFFAENRYICTVMQGDTAEMQAKRAGGARPCKDGRRCGIGTEKRHKSLIYIRLTNVQEHLYPHFSVSLSETFCAQTAANKHISTDYPQII